MKRVGSAWPGPDLARLSWREETGATSGPHAGQAPMALPLGALRRFVSREGQPQRRPLERCELCRAVLLPTHHHLLAPERRQVLCVCDPCALLFRAGTQLGQGQYRLIPERYRWLRDLALTDAEWEALGLPVNLVYLFYSTPAGRLLAFYPGPAGATESLLDLDGWQGLVARYPLLGELLPDVEALLINRVRGARETYLVPIDVCFRLTGLIRANWRGLSGGAELERALASFFADLQARAEVVAVERTAPDRGEGEDDA
ncbi:DUF5947 family protein [Thermogemmatispora carboxidivorans]|uniref:DUF5947 family protein n=1 Tax=Thermogemmatispora carboxidivorans TaxID=1382306 RepID=UPI001EE23F6B|nr:DUF5947 family protein [Thermogemmatispora carboxidivorans]